MKICKNIYLDNIKKIEKIRSYIKKEGLSKKKGAELAESILLIAISVVIVVTLFYPQINAVFTNVISNVVNWFNNAMFQIGI